MSIGSFLAVAIPVALNALVIYFVLTAPRPRYLRVLLFAAVQILVACVDAVSLSEGSKNTYYKIYWAGDLLAHGFVFLLILGLIGQGLAHLKEVRKIVWGLAAGVLVFALISAYVFYSPHVNRWMNPLSRNMSFGEEVLNIILWGIVLHTRETRDSDNVLLMVTGGIGVQVTGEVIGHTLRFYSQDSGVVWVPSMLVYLSEVLCLVIWILAFRSASRTEDQKLDAHAANGGAS